MGLSREEEHLEETHLRRVLQQIDREIQQSSETAEERKGQLIGGKRELTEDVVYDADDWFEAAVQLTQQAQELSQHARSYRLAQGRREHLERLQSTPYFGRFDFREEGAAESEAIYIGTMSLSDPTTHEMIIYDWRAPISGIYYDYGPGPASYEAPDGMVSGEMLLKRQFIIRGGKLLSAFDTGVTIGDEMLQRMLGQHADDKMKSIVTTIQREQNKIIRETKRKYVFVQGVAGSGKTSAALQRIAYLLYKYRKVWLPEQFILFSPNDVFNDYVSNVLPELGEDSIPQTTFYDYVWRRLKHVREVEHPYDQLEYLYSYTSEQREADIRTAGIRLKASLEFAERIDAFAETLSERGVRFRPLTRNGKTIVSATILEKLFYKTYQKQKMPMRLSSMQEWLNERVSELERKRAAALFQKWSKEPKYLGTDDELKRLSIAKSRKTYGPIREQIKKFGFLDIIETYLHLFESALEQKDSLPVGSDLWNRIAADTSERLTSAERLPYEDAVPMLYLLEALHGASRMNRVRVCVVDEAQDYTPLQWAYLQRLFPNAGITAVGDLSQAIHESISDAGHLESAQLFPEEETFTLRLNRSYRSTRQIVDFTRSLLSDEVVIEPFNRDGEKPKVSVVSEAAADDAYAAVAADNIAHLRKGGYHSIAVITKTAAERDEAHRLLMEQGIELTKLTNDTKVFPTGTVVMPSYMSKGLEFDACLVWNANADNYSSGIERKLLYTVCTRALHRLIIIAKGKLSPLIEQVPVETYTK